MEKHVGLYFLFLQKYETGRREKKRPTKAQMIQRSSHPVLRMISRLVYNLRKTKTVDRLAHTVEAATIL